MATHIECQLQQVCVNHLKYRYSRYLGCWNHSPNEGKRTAFQGAVLRKMGMTKGWPDLEIMVASGKWFGLFIEFKTKTGRQSEDQAYIQKALEAHGYRYEIVRSLDEFKVICKDYLGKEEDPDREQLLKILNDDKR